MEGPAEQARNGQPRVFGRYTERARVVIYFACQDASLHRSPEVGTEHLLQGLFLGDRRGAIKVLGLLGFIKRYASFASSMKAIRRNVSLLGKKSQFPQMPLSIELKRVLGHAANEADRVQDKHVRPKHLLIGLLMEGESAGARLLKQEGITLESLRARLGE